MFCLESSDVLVQEVRCFLLSEAKIHAFWLDFVCVLLSFVAEGYQFTENSVCFVFFHSTMLCAEMSSKFKG